MNSCPTAVFWEHNNWAVRVGKQVNTTREEGHAKKRTQIQSVFSLCVALEHTGPNRTKFHSEGCADCSRVFSSSSKLTGHTLTSLSMQSACACACAHVCVFMVCVLTRRWPEIDQSESICLSTTISLLKRIKNTNKSQRNAEKSREENLLEKNKTCDVYCNLTKWWAAIFSLPLLNFREKNEDKNRKIRWERHEDTRWKKRANNKWQRRGNWGKVH